MLVQGAAEGVKLLNDAGYLVLVVSNQSGVARGYHEEADVLRFNAHLAMKLGSLGARIDGFYFCPHHPDGVRRGYNQRCDCRKPAPGLLHAADRDWSIDRRRSFLVGDMPTDLEAATAFGVRSYIFGGDDLLGALTEIIKLERSLPQRNQHA